MNVLIHYPSLGSVWLDDAEIRGRTVYGAVWDDSERGSPHLPDDYRGEYTAMNFPVSCIAKTEGAVPIRWRRRIPRHARPAKWED